MSPPTAQTPLERVKAHLQDATYNALPADEMLEEAVMVKAVAVVAGRYVRLGEETSARITHRRTRPPPGIADTATDQTAQPLRLA